MKNLNEMTAKELKEMAKGLKISNWWNLKKEVLIKKIEEVQNMSEEEKQAIADQKAKEDAAIEEYTKNWQKYTSRYNVSEFLIKWKSGEIILESEKPDEEIIEKEVEEEIEETEEKIEESKPIKEKAEIEPFVYTDENGDEWEDYDIGEMIAKWSDEKKAAFKQFYEESKECTEDNIKDWSKAFDKTAGKPKKEKSSDKVKKPSLKIKELTYKGETKTIREWADELGMDWPTLYDRVNRNGWTVEEAIETPLGQRRKKKAE